MIEFRNIKIVFGNFVAIPDLSLKINKGEFFTLLGPSGCGKTTTLRALVGFNLPEKGQIFIEDEDVTNLPVEKREIGMVFQSYALFPTMTVYENIAFGLKIKKESKSEIDLKVKDIAKKVDLTEEQLQKKVSDLSGGQQQRVAIARALVLKPKILVLDEPLSNLDAKLRKQLRTELKSLQRKFGITTIYVTHDQEEALTLSDRIAVFNKGVVEQVGTPHEIYKNSKTEFVCNFIGDINKIEKEYVKVLNENFNLNLDESISAYVRPENINLMNFSSTDDFIKLETKIIDSEYYGSFVKNSYDFNGLILKNIEKENRLNKINFNENIFLYINKNDILQFGK